MRKSGIAEIVEGEIAIAFHLTGISSLAHEVKASVKPPAEDGDPLARQVILLDTDAEHVAAIRSKLTRLRRARHPELGR